MDIDEWWYRLRPETQEWLIANNGDAVPEDMVAEIVQAGAVIGSDSWWIGEPGQPGFFLSDAAIDWIEAVANEEAPQGRSARP